MSKPIPYGQTIGADILMLSFTNPSARHPSQPLRRQLPPVGAGAFYRTALKSPSFHQKPHIFIEQNKQHITRADREDGVGMADGGVGIEVVGAG